jgi:hypothetical protein
VNGQARLKSLSILAVLGLLCGLVYQQVTLAPPSWFPGDIGVAAVPGLVNTVLGVLLLVLAVQTLLGWKIEVDAPESAITARLQWDKMGGVTLLYFLFIAAAACTDLHFGLLAAAFLAISLWLLRGGGWRGAFTSLVFGVLIAGLCQLLFVNLFGIIMP